MEWKLADARKAQYDSMIKTAQDLEATIGSAQVRMHKLISMRDEIDVTLKNWWEEILKELSLPQDRDYMVSRDGQIKDITKPKSTDVQPTELNKSMVGSNASNLV